jgi:hypothetical protein
MCQISHTVKLDSLLLTCGEFPLNCDLHLDRLVTTRHRGGLQTKKKVSNRIKGWDENEAAEPYVWIELSAVKRFHMWRRASPRSHHHGPVKLLDPLDKRSTIRWHGTRTVSGTVSAGWANPPLDGGACVVLFIREPLHPWFPRACQRDTF